MKNTELLDIYSDYLISAFGPTTGTGLAGLMGGSVSHDQLQRLLSKERFGSAELWQIVKPYVRQIQQEDAVRETVVGTQGEGRSRLTRGRWKIEPLILICTRDVRLLKDSLWSDDNML